MKQFTIFIVVMEVLLAVVVLVMVLITEFITVVGVVVVVEMVPIVMVCYHGCSLLVAEVAGRGWPSRRLVVVVLVVAMADRNDGWSLVNGHLVQ